ncbi:MAG: 3-phosphoserine/phosphohydroxythreonine transaminase [Armatimonadetes bacterium]|nr:3-phosphoserine/phosphohydroxythreonine transaminase [Armatimonadota bacterium]
MNRIYNFSAGPGIQPVAVLEEASQAVLEFQGSGMSILELSHRGKHYDPVHAEAQALVLSSLGLSKDEYTIALLGGGASMQFAMLPMNFIRPGDTADYVDAGEWGAKAIAEAARFGSVHLAGSSKATNYDQLPELAPSGKGRYFHLTTNNTIEGTQVFDLPATDGTPLVADASSDIFGVHRDYSKFDLIYAGAQKNAGPAGVTLVVIRKSFLERAHKDLPPMFSYITQCEKQSLYNTPPVFPIYVLGLTLKWIAAQGGVKRVAVHNQAKAQLIYDALDACPSVFSSCVAVKEHRSWMNITFRLATPELEKHFLAEAKAAGMDGLPGHRNVGGFRASIYNAFPIAGCEALAALIRDFSRRNG